jgi:sugar phosphate permease
MDPGAAAAPEGRRWLMLVVGLVAQAASCAFLYGLPFLLPELRQAYGLSLTQAGLLVSAPSLGLVTTLVAWGAFVDRFGERLAMTIGLGAAGLILVLSRWPHDLTLVGVLFGLAGAASASVNAASGRVVMGWFGAHERGLAMGARQMAQPIGVAIAALVLPPLAGAVGVRDALLFPAGFCLVTAVVVVVLVVDPPRPARTVGGPSDNPYRTPALWRLHASSALLVVPQFAVTVFSQEYLVAVRHWSSGPAGRVLAGVQLVGACGRLAVGRWSDHVGSRLRPMRQIAVASAAAMLAVGAAAASGRGIVLLALAVATVISVTDNGLGFTATAELAGRAWSGRALGMQNTAQNLVAFATPSVFAALVGQWDYAGAFVVCAVFPAIGVLTTPVRAEEAAGVAP